MKKHSMYEWGIMIILALVLEFTFMSLQHDKSKFIFVSLYEGTVELATTIIGRK